jgi:hypothetical protein
VLQLKKRVASIASIDPDSDGKVFSVANGGERSGALQAIAEAGTRKLFMPSTSDPVLSKAEYPAVRPDPRPPIATIFLKDVALSATLF